MKKIKNFLKSSKVSLMSHKKEEVYTRAKGKLNYKASVSNLEEVLKSDIYVNILLCIYLKDPLCGFESLSYRRTDELSKNE